MGRLGVGHQRGGTKMEDRRNNHLRRKQTRPPQQVMFSCFHWFNQYTTPVAWCRKFAGVFQSPAEGVPSQY